MSWIVGGASSSLLFQTVATCFAIPALCYVYINFFVNTWHPDFPVIRLGKDGSGDDMFDWLQNARAVIDKGVKTTDGPFQVTSAFGPMVLLPTKFAHELRNDPRVSLTKAIKKAFFTHYPGFEAFVPADDNGRVVRDVVQGKLTQSLGLITNDIVDEADLVLSEKFPASKEWRTVEIKEDLLQVVARLSARVFLGFPFCRDPSWLELSKSHTISTFVAASKLRRTAPYLRPIAARFWIPECQQIRDQVAQARIILKDEIAMRKARAEEAIANGKTTSKRNDSVGWMVEVAHKRGIKTDYAAGQLNMSIGAIHTTAEAMTRSLLDCCQHPEVVKPLRQEMLSALNEYGWSRNMLSKLRYMDSFLKESQRCSPGQLVNMHRMVTEKIVLSNGTALPAGTHMDVLPGFDDSEVFNDPTKFDAERFMKLRNEPNQDMSWQYVSLHASHMGFGYGEHACPGRFFATNEVKIALFFLLLRYDWELVNEGSALMQPEDGVSIVPDLKLRYKSRTSEVDLISLIDAKELEEMRSN